MRQTFNLNEMGGVFKKQHDLPRRVGKNGKMEMEFDWADQGWYFTKGETTSSRAASLRVRPPISLKNARYSYSERCDSAKDFVDLTQEDTCLVTTNKEDTLKRKRFLKFDE